MSAIPKCEKCRNRADVRAYVENATHGQEMDLCHGCVCVADGLGLEVDVLRDYAREDIQARLDAIR
jgi:hypothetical protein